MRIVVAFLFLVMVGVALQARQQGNVRTNPGLPCGDQSSGLPDFYEETFLRRIEPPRWRNSVVRIAVGAGIKLDLWTDGQQFKLWTDTLTPRNIDSFLLNLDQSCRLPADPADAVALVKVKWESVDLSPTQFAQIHRGFTNALAEYASRAQLRYGTTMTVIHLDASSFPIVYDNSHEHVEVQVWDDPKEDKPLLAWIEQLERLAKESFHRPFVRPNE